MHKIAPVFALSDPNLRNYETGLGWFRSLRVLRNFTVDSKFSCNRIVSDRGELKILEILADGISHHLQPFSLFRHSSPAVHLNLQDKMDMQCVVRTIPLIHFGINSYIRFSVDGHLVP